MSAVQRAVGWERGGDEQTCGTMPYPGSRRSCTSTPPLSLYSTLSPSSTGPDSLSALLSLRTDSDQSPLSLQKSTNGMHRINRFNPLYLLYRFELMATVVFVDGIITVFQWGEFALIAIDQLVVVDQSQPWVWWTTVSLSVILVANRQASLFVNEVNNLPLSCHILICRVTNTYQTQHLHVGSYNNCNTIRLDKTL